MGYFPNGTAGGLYQEKWCDRCIHREGCTVMLAHMLHNYAECNNPDSILHLLIPRDKEGWNEKCTLFVETAKIHHGQLPSHLAGWGKAQGIVEVGNADLSGRRSGAESC